MLIFLADEAIVTEEKSFIETVENYLKTDGVTLVRGITTILIGYMVIKLIISCLKRGVAKSTNIEKTIPNFVISILNIVLMAILILCVVHMMGLSTDSVVTIASVVSLGVSLALQGTISGLVNGIIIVSTKPFVEGEYISSGDVEGTVTQITMFHTILKTADGILVTLPNSTITAGYIKNYSRLPIRRIAIDIPVAYGTKIDTVKNLVMDYVSKNPNILSNPGPSCRLSEYQDSNLSFSLKCWVPTSMYWDIRFDLLEGIINLLDENSISIDYNQVDVHIKDVPGKGGRE